MSDLAKQIGLEIASMLSNTPLPKKVTPVVVYAGRFHPFHKGHHSVYEKLVEKFGADRVFIGTSNKKELPESPFSFEEKKLIMTTMFGIPENRVIQTKSPYAPREILDRFESNTPVVVAISEKDKDRFDGQKYYQALPEGDHHLEGYENTGYYVVAPEYQMKLQNGRNVSGTAIRNIFGNSDASTKAKRRLFGQMYGRVNRKIFELIVRRSLTSEKARVATERDPTKKITNPETGREIMVKNALKYSPDHPAHRAAKAEVSEVFGSLARAYHPLFISTVGLIVGIQASEALSERLNTLPEPLRKIAGAERVQDVVQLIRNNPNVQKIIKALEKLPQGKEHVIGLIRLLGKAVLTNINPKERRSLLSMSPGLEEMWVWDLPKVVRGVVAEPNDWKLTEEVMISRVLLTEYRRRVETQSIIKEGGAAGHINHPFEDFQLTFGDLKRIVELGLEGKLDVEAPVTEKLDGQQISVTCVPDIGVVFARNKTHMAGKGMNALHVDSVAEMFAGRGDLTDAFTFAAADLEKAINKLTKAQKETLFGDGSKWVSVEIIFPATQNVVPYGHNLLVFHSTVEVDDNGNAIGIGTGVRDIQAMLNQVNQDVRDTFTFKGPNVVTFPRAKNFSIRKGHYFGRIEKLQRQFRLTDNDPVIMWHHCWWESFIDSQARKHKYNMSPRVRGGLINRWAHLRTGAYTVNDMKRDIMRGGIGFDTENNVEVKNPRAEKFLAWALDFDKTSKKDQFQENMEPFEAIFLNVGAEILQNARGLLSLSPDADSIRKDLDRAIAELSRTKDIKKLKRFREQLKKLEDVGMDKLVPTEGIVFMFGEKIYKLTGTFAPLNQLLGLLKYGQERS